MLRLLRLLLIVLVPYLVIMFPVRAVFSPWLVAVEYGMPGFPADPVSEVEPLRAMTPTERLRLGVEGLQGTSASNGHQILLGMKFDNGQRVFDDREVKHLDDVRAIINVLFPIHSIVALSAILLGVLLGRLSRPSLASAIRAGAVATIAIVGVILVGAIVGWDEAFTAFHRIFFSGDSWLFNWDDALIRLYPVEFWQIVTAMLGVTILGTCGLLLLVSNRLARIDSAKP